MAQQDSKKARAAKAKRAKKREQASSGDRAKQLEARAKQANAEARRNKLRSYGFNAALVLGLAVFGWFVFRPGPELPGVERPNDDGRGHIVNASYDSPTPTSGRHRAELR